MREYPWKEYQRRYRERHRAELKVRNLQYFTRLKEEALSHYSRGVPVCKICGFSDMRALTIDHINNDGLAERKRLNIHGGWHFYVWLKRQSYPEGYQVLCMNCQFIKEMERRKTKE